ncbi:hypothetical protein NBRC116597_15240 [Phaeobacter sp. NW0010-22]
MNAAIEARIADFRCGCSPLMLAKAWIADFAANRDIFGSGYYSSLTSVAGNIAYSYL